MDAFIKYRIPQHNTNNPIQRGIADLDLGEYFSPWVHLRNFCV